MEETTKRPALMVDEFKSKKEVIKAQYSAAEAQVKIEESITDISKEMADVSMAIDRAEDKTAKMKAKSQAPDDTMNSGVLTDYTPNND
jgi:phage shock protein A